MGFSLQELWHRRTGSTALAASGSGNSFTNFEVNAETKHPGTAPKSPVKRAARSSLIKAEKVNLVPSSAASGNARNPSLWSTSSSQQMKNHRYMPIPQQQKDNAQTSGYQTSNPAGPIDDGQRNRGLKRTLSKVRSLTEIQLPSYQRRGHTQSLSDGNDVRSSCALTGSRASAFEAPASSETSKQQGKTASGLSSFIRRKLSLDSLASPHSAGEATSSSGIATTPVISSPLLSNSPWSFLDSAFIVDSEDGPIINDESLITGTSRQNFYPPSQTSGSSLDATGIMRNTSPRLPEIREERENAFACDRSSVGHLAQSVGMQSAGMQSVGMQSVGMQSVGMQSVGMQSVGMQSVGMQSIGMQSVRMSFAGQPKGYSKTKEPIFKATPRNWRDSTGSNRRQSVTSNPKHASAYISKALPPDPRRAKAGYHMIASGWSLASY